jgi:SAM-dependent methyltransferase
VTGPAFQDHFSGHAAVYAAARPDYPAELFDWLASIAPGRSMAWDVGTGNGQAAVALAARFDRVIATDPSAEQIANAVADPRIEYRVARAEDGAGVASACVDLITVAQSLHWFDRPAFYQRVRDTLVPGGVIAAWCYGLSTVDAAVDSIVEDFYTNVVGPYWPPDRSWVEDGYRTIDFPFAEINAPAFAMQHDWTLKQFLAYLQTWSAVKRYTAGEGRDPIEPLQDRLAAGWGHSRSKRMVRWPLYLCVGRV